MRHILASMVLVVLLLPALALGETVKFEDFVIWQRVYYKNYYKNLLVFPSRGKLRRSTRGQWETIRKRVSGYISAATDSYRWKEPSRTESSSITRR